MSFSKELITKAKRLYVQHEDLFHSTWTFIFSNEILKNLTENEIESFGKWMIMGYLLIDNLPNNKLKQIVNSVRDYSFLTTNFIDIIPTKILKDILTKNPLSNFWYFWLFGTKDGQKQVFTLLKKPHLVFIFLIGIGLTLSETSDSKDKEILDNFFKIFSFLKFDVDVSCVLKKSIGTVLTLYATKEPIINKFIKTQYTNLNNHIAKIGRESQCNILGGRRIKIHKGPRGGKYYIKKGKKIYIKKN